MTLRNIDALFSGKSTCVLGTPETPAQQQMFENLSASASTSDLNHVKSGAAPARLPYNPGASAVIMDTRWGRPEIISALAKAGDILAITAPCSASHAASDLS